MPDLDALRLRKQLHTERSFYWIVIAALLVAVFFIGFSEKQSAINVDGKTIVWVDSSKTGQSVKRALEREYRDKATRDFGRTTGSSFRFKEQVTITRGEVEGPRVLSRQEALRRLRSSVTPQVKGTLILVGGAPVVAVPTRQMAEATIEGVKLKLSGGDPHQASQAKIKGGSKIAEQYVDMKLMRKSAESAVAYLTGSETKTSSSDAKAPTAASGTVAKGSYAVQPGDTGMAIARKFQMSMDDLEKLNPGVDWEKLKIGDTLRVSRSGSVSSHATDSPSASPSNFSVESVQTRTEKETVPFQTVRRRSLKLKPGEVEVRRKGQKGERIKRYRIHLQNGKEVKRVLIDEEVSRQPVNEEILYGGKEPPASSPSP